MQASTPQIYSRNAIRFSLGSVVATPGALELIQQAGISVLSQANLQPQVLLQLIK